MLYFDFLIFSFAFISLTGIKKNLKREQKSSSCISINLIIVYVFSDLKGVIVTLSDSGRLVCSYLGTDPALFIPPPVESRDLNYADMDREMAQLQKVIKEQQSKSGKKYVSQTHV